MKFPVLRHTKLTVSDAFCIVVERLRRKPRVNKPNYYPEATLGLELVGRATGSAMMGESNTETLPISGKALNKLDELAFVRIPNWKKRGTLSLKLSR